MKKLFLTLTFSILVCIIFVFAVSAKNVYLEIIPDELKVPNDTATHFVVFEEEKYYTGEDSTISGFNTGEMDADMATAGIDSSKIGTEYLTRFNIPAYLNGKLITYVNLNSMKSNKYFWGKCGYIQLAGTVNKLHDMNEATSQLRCIDFGENSQVKEIPYCFCPSSTRLMSIKNFPRKLTLISDTAFNKCYNAFRGELYLNAQTIGASAFNNALNHLEGLVFGPDTKTIGNQSLCVRLSEVPNSARPENDILPLKYIEFQCDVSKVNFATQGKDLGAFYFIGTDRSPYEMLTCIILSHPDNVSKVAEGSVFNDFLAEGQMVLFNDSNGEDDYVFASHTYSNATISYSSFLKKGVKSVACADCGKLDCQETEAVFECLGYSVKKFDDFSFSIGYKTNFEALTEYEKATGLKVDYGIVAASKLALGEEKPIDQNGKPIVLENGTVVMVALGGELTYFDGAIGNFTSDSQKDAMIVLCAYVIVSDKDGNITSISYLQESETSDGSLIGVSYNSLSQKAS